MSNMSSDTKNMSFVVLEMRKIAIEYIINIHHKKKLVPNTLFLSIDIFDAFLIKIFSDSYDNNSLSKLLFLYDDTISNNNAKSNDDESNDDDILRKYSMYSDKNMLNPKILEELMVISLFIASKIEDVFPINLDYTRFVLSNRLTSYDVLIIETIILETIDYNIYIPNAFVHSFIAKQLIAKQNYLIANQNFEEKFEQEFKEDFVQEFKQDFEHDFKQDYEQEYERENKIKTNIFRYILTSLYLTMDYRYVKYNLLADKILIFCSHESLLLIDKNDPITQLIYKNLIYIKNSGIKTIVNTLFSKINDYDIILNIDTNTNINININNFNYDVLFVSEDIHNNKIYNRLHKKDINKIKKIGFGTYANVYHVVNVLTNDNFAMKKIYKSQSNEGVDYLGLREINSLKLLSGLSLHPNIIQLLGYAYNPINQVFIIGLDLMECTLGNYIKTNNNIPTNIKKSFILQILSGLSYIHSKFIIHRDLTSNNILINNNVLKIADLGSSRYVYNNEYNSKNINSNNICTIWFRPIESLLNCTDPYTYKVDVWSTACVIMLIINCKYLFCGNNEYEMVLEIFKLLGKPHTTFYPELLEYTECERFATISNFKPNFTQQLFHDDFKYVSPIVYEMFEYIPEKRLDSLSAYNKFTDIFNIHSS